MSFGNHAARRGEVKRLVIWGNHSSTLFPDIENATIAGRPTAEAVTDRAWLEAEFIQSVQQEDENLVLNPLFSLPERDIEILVERSEQPLFERPLAD